MSDNPTSAVPGPGGTANHVFNASSERRRALYLHSGPDNGAAAGHGVFGSWW